MQLWRLAVRYVTIDDIRGLKVNLGARWGWVVNATPRQLFPPGRPGTHCTGGWVGPRAGLGGCGKFRLTEIRSPDRPACRESLYRLRYPAHIFHNLNL